MWLTPGPGHLKPQVFLPGGSVRRASDSESPSLHLSVKSGKAEELGRQAKAFGLDSALQGGEGWTELQGPPLLSSRPPPCLCLQLWRPLW